nr:MAG TPA: chitin synthase regulator [Caudoviricetes sp.]
MMLWFFILILPVLIILECAGKSSGRRRKR